MKNGLTSYLHSFAYQNTTEFKGAKRYSMLKANVMSMMLLSS